MIPSKRFDISPPNWGMLSEGLDAFSFSHKHSPARMRYSNKVLYTIYRTTEIRRTDDVVVCWLLKFHEF